MFHKLINKQLNNVVMFLVITFYLIHHGNTWGISSRPDSPYKKIGMRRSTVGKLIQARYYEIAFLLQCVPLATETGISSTILPLMKTLQRNLKRTYLIV